MDGPDNEDVTGPKNGDMNEPENGDLDGPDNVGIECGSQDEGPQDADISSAGCK